MIGAEPPDIERRPLTLVAALLQPGPVALLTARHRGRHDVVPVAWHMPASAEPPLVLVALPREAFANDLIRAGEEFALNIPPRTLLHHLAYLQDLPGEDVDKLEATQLESFPPVHITAPLLRDCVAWVECEVQAVAAVGDHVHYTALPRLLRVRPQVFGERWRTDAPPSMRPLQHLGGRTYVTFGAAVEARPPAALDAPERVLAERIAEDLELTREAHERRAEELGRLRAQVEAGAVVDLAALGIDPEDAADATADAAGRDHAPDIDWGGAMILGGGPARPPDSGAPGA